jgi:hypothetical protein
MCVFLDLLPFPVQDPRMPEVSYHLPHLLQGLLVRQAQLLGDIPGKLFHRAAAVA